MRHWLGVSTVLAAIAICGSASAQYNKSDLEVHASGFSFRGGLVLPWDAPLRDVSKTMIGLGMEYSFQKQVVKNSETYVSLDWFGKSLSGTHGNIFPLCINQRFYTGASRYGTGRAYFFAGLGVTFIDVNGATDKLGARGGVGMELSQTLFAEAAAYMSGKDNGGVAGNALGFYVGYRFP